MFFSFSFSICFLFISSSYVYMFFSPLLRCNGGHRRRRRALPHTIILTAGIVSHNNTHGYNTRLLIRAGRERIAGVLYWPETTRFYAEAGPRGIPRTVLQFASLPAPAQIQRNAIFLPVPRAAAELDAVNCVQTGGRAAARKRWTQHSSRQVAG